MILWLENTSLFKISLYHPPPYTVFVLLSRAISGLLNCEQNWGLPLQWVRIRGIYFVLFACRDISVLWSREGGFWEVRVDNNGVEEFFQFSFEIETTERDKGDFECRRSEVVFLFHYPSNQISVFSLHPTEKILVQAQHGLCAEDIASFTKSMNSQN